MNLNKVLTLTLSILTLNLSSYNKTYAENISYLNKGNQHFEQYVNTQNKQELENAYFNYYKASQTTPCASSFLGMGMVFIEKDMYSRAKIYLYKAYNIDENDAATNYYLGKFYFKNEEFVKALDFYTRAFELGLSDNYDLNLKIATIYEKVGDFEQAKNYYETAQNLNPADTSLKNKSQYLDNLNANKIKYFSEWD